MRLAYEKEVAKGMDERFDLVRPISYNEMIASTGSRMIYTAVRNLEKEVEKADEDWLN